MFPKHPKWRCMYHQIVHLPKPHLTHKTWSTRAFAFGPNYPNETCFLTFFNRAAISFLITARHFYCAALTFGPHQTLPLEKFLYKISVWMFKTDGSITYFPPQRALLGLKMMDIEWTWRPITDLPQCAHFGGAIHAVKVFGRTLIVSFFSYFLVKLKSNQYRLIAACLKIVATFKICFKSSKNWSELGKFVLVS